MVRERIDPYSEKNIMRLSRLAHLKRYYKAAELIDDGDLVLDAGCGYGYGSKILGSKNANIIALDNSCEALEYASNNYNGNNITYCLGDLESYDFSKFGRFCVIAFFEVLEHLHNPSAMIKKFKTSMKDSGKLIVSVPNGKNASKNNEHHIQNYCSKDLEDLLNSNGFEVKKKFGQYPLLGILAGAASKITDYQSCTDKESGFIPILIDSVPFLPEFFSNLYNSRIAVSTGRTIYFVAESV